MAFGPIVSATCLRRAASSSQRFALSNTGAGGVIRIAGGAGASFSPLARPTGNVRVEIEIATVRTVAMQKSSFLFMVILFKVVVAGDLAFDLAETRAWCRYAW